MSKYIEVKLTEDQVNTITQCLMQRQEDDSDESTAFRWRLVKALKNAKEQREHQCDATCTAFSHRTES